MSENPHPPHYGPVEEEEDPAAARRAALPGLFFCLVMLGAALWVGLKFLLEAP